MAKLGKDVSVAILEALGAPIEGCTGVEVELRTGDFAAVLIRYHITPDMLIRLGRLMEQNREHL